MKQKKEKITADNRSVVSVEVIITYSNGEKESVSVLELFDKGYSCGFYRGTNNIVTDNSGFDKWLEEKSEIKVKVRVPTYSFFCEVEDGLMYIKGVNKEMLVGTVDEVRWPRAEKQYAMYLLKNDNDLTEDDKVVLNKIIVGNI